MVAGHRLRLQPVRGFVPAQVIRRPDPLNPPCDFEVAKDYLSKDQLKMEMRLIALVAAVSAACLAAPVAEAASVSKKVEIAAAPDKVWAAIGGFCDIGSWLTIVVKCEMTETGGKKVRTLTTGDGGVLVETLEQWDEAHRSYTYRIHSSPLPMENYVATIRVLGEGAASTVEWSSTFDPKDAQEADVVKTISSIYQIGFDGLKKKL
jgi:hypothetical protein